MLIALHDQIASNPNTLIFAADFRLSKAFDTIRVLLLANDMIPGGSIAASLTAANCTVTHAGTIDMMIAQTRGDDFDVIVVDFRPDLLGYQAVRQLRLAPIDIPVLFISACSTMDAFSRAYDVGADDVAVLPLDRSDLKNRLASLVMRSGDCRRPRTMRIGPLELDLPGRYVRIDGKPLLLQSDEYAAIELLASRNGAPLGKTTIAKIVCDGIDPESCGDVDKLITRLRRKLAKAGAGDLIQSVWGLGYVLSFNGHSNSRPTITPKAA